MPENEIKLIKSLPGAFFDGLGIGISLVDSQTDRILFANGEFARIFDYSRDELDSGAINFSALIHPQDKKLSLAQRQLLLAGEIDRYRLDKRYVLRNGHMLWAHVTVKAIKDSKGKIRWFTGAVEDISAKKLMEQQLMAAAQVSGLAAWDWEVKPDSVEKRTGSNASCKARQTEALLSLEDAISHVHPEDREAVATTVRRALITRSGYTQEYRSIQPNTELRWMRTTATCLYNEAGEVTNLFGATVDITKMKVEVGHDPVAKPIRDILRHIEVNWHTPIVVADLARQYGVSARSIYRHFALRGLSLMKYVKLIRLQHAHWKLGNPEPGTTVTAVAFECGFSNLGHFSKDYRLEFGELPSETLKNAF